MRHPRACEPERGTRRGATLLEVLFAIVLMMIVMGGATAFFHSGTRSVVTSTDHAQAREDAMKVLERVGQDLDRLIVSDSPDQVTFPSVLEPLLIAADQPQASKFMFYGFHHREYDRSTREMKLIGMLIEYKVVKRPDGGVDLLRNDEPINPSPLSDVRIRSIPEEEAATLNISARHAFKITVHPRGTWNTRNQALAEHNPQTRLFHLSGIESQYSCLLSLKESGAPYPYPILAALPPPPPRPEAYAQYGLSVPLDWMQPLGLVKLEEAFFDDATAGENKDFGTAPPPASRTRAPPAPPGPCGKCSPCPRFCPGCNGGSSCVCGGCGGSMCRG